MIREPLRATYQNPKFVRKTSWTWFTLFLELAYLKSPPPIPHLHTPKTPLLTQIPPIQNKHIPTALHPPHSLPHPPLIRNIQGLHPHIHLKHPLNQRLRLLQLLPPPSTKESDPTDARAGEGNGGFSADAGAAAGEDEVFVCEGEGEGGVVLGGDAWVGVRVKVGDWGGESVGVAGVFWGWVRHGWKMKVGWVVKAVGKKGESRKL